MPLNLTKASLSTRYKVANERKLLWRSLLEDVYEYVLPQRDTFDQLSPGQRKNRIIYDSTACEAAREFASVMQALLTPPWREFSKMTVGKQVILGRSEDDVIGINQQLDDITEIVFDNLNHSNFHQQATESYLDLSVGTGAMTSGWIENPITGTGELVFKSMPLRNLVLEEGPQGTVENVWRNMKMTLEHAERMWPGIQFTSSEKTKVTKMATGKEEFKEAVLFDPATFMYKRIVVDKNFEVRWEMDEGESSPWIVFRWNVNPNEIYGRGPGIMMLHDIRMLNKIKEFILRNGALTISNVYTMAGGQEAAFNPFTIKLEPNMVIPVRSNANQNPTLRALERAGDLNFGDVLTQELRRDIRRAFLNDTNLPDQAVRSATEVSIENAQLVRRIGAEFGRLQTEYVEKLVTRVVFILQRENIIPPMRIDGRAITLQHTSPLARAQDQEELISLQNTLATIQGLPPEMIMQEFKLEKLASWVHEKNGGDPNLIRTPEEKLELQQKIANAIEQQGAQQGGGQAALPAPQQ